MNDQQSYDEQQLAELNIKQPDMHSLGLEETLKVIGELKLTLITKGEETEFFGQVRGDGLTSALATLRLIYRG